MNDPVSPSAPAWRLFWCALGAASVGFHLWLIFSGLVPNLVSRPLHMALALPWALVYGAKSPAARWSGAAMCAVGLAACGYIAANATELGDQYGFLSGPMQTAMAVALLVIVLEMARRAIGWPLPLIAALALGYGLFGQHIGGEFGHAGLPLSSFLGTLTITEGGIWGSLTGISVGVVAVFVIFGAVLNAGEAGQGFMNLATAAAGRLRGGAAKVSVLASALFGSISGSASANVASTGAVTLPAMTALGYPRRLAGAVEAVASSGGQIMPPLMGAGAFVMVELTGIPYTEIVIAALIPAILYFTTVWLGIDAFALRFGLKGLPSEQMPRAATVLATAAFFAVPFVVLLVVMFAIGMTPQYAAALAILSAAALLLFDARGLVGARRFLARAETVCLTAGGQVAMIASIILCASIVIGVLGMTGLGVKLTSLILSGAGGSLWPALLLTALACLVLGMEVPTTAAYVICVSIAGPALQGLGLEPLTAHLFVFWFALLSTITPPVCGAVFIAAGMVGENWLRVALTAMALGMGLYIVPLCVVHQPALIALGARPAAALAEGAVTALGLGLLSYGLIAPFTLPRRAALIGAGCVVLVAFGGLASRFVGGG
ncbi:TRAP transporter fused permease subunit [Limibaculum sp. M0105]|uniref:TRAP transporter fused permease subunit n=1 Tax=Thermohalobaculum xanthum TaxID=2753746 RepID=A0A8J7M8Z4_9RHOB|nr:TRAP transporter fused permease subunit [Thermohalobaculum xanthum]MBK0400057.1 TRAP transporter fused permease subunit [Thermohalobaculum xanthum]